MSIYGMATGEKKPETISYENIPANFEDRDLLIDFIKRLTAKRICQRLNCEEALQHDWMQVHVDWFDGDIPLKDSNKLKKIEELPTLTKDASRKDNWSKEIVGQFRFRKTNRGSFHPVKYFGELFRNFQRKYTYSNGDEGFQCEYCTKIMRINTSNPKSWTFVEMFGKHACV